MDATREKHVEVHAVEGSHIFFSDNFEEKQNQLVHAEKNLKQFRNENKFLSIQGARATQQSVINKLELELIDAESNYRQAQKRLEEIQKQMSKIDRLVAVPTSGVEKLSTEDSRTELFKLEAELKRLEKTLSRGHPRLKALKSTVASLRSEFREMPAERTESAMKINPVYEKVKVSLVGAMADATAFRERHELLVAKCEEANSRLRLLNEKEIEAGKLQRDMDVAQQEMAIYMRKRTESAVIDQLNKQWVSDIVIAQPANLMVKQVSPKGSVFAPLGAVFACFCAIGTALYFEKDLLSGHLSEEELEQILEIPILVSLPTVSSQRNMVG